MIYKIKFLLLLSLTGIFFLCSCKKNTSIVGVWNETSIRYQEINMGQVVYDTSYQIASGTSVYTFKADNTYTLIQTNGNDAGTYTYTSGKITLASSHYSGNLVLNVDAIGTHNMTLHLNDTTSVTPENVLSGYLYFTR